MKWSNRRKASLLNYDWITVSLYFVLAVIGIISIYSTSFDENQHGLLNTFYGKQSIWLLFSIIIIFSINIINLKFIKNNASIFYLVGILLLILVLIFGAEINGNKSWFRFGSFSIQPAEFAKVTTALGLAGLLTEHSFGLQNLKHIFQSFILILTPALLILLQPDLGSVIIFFSFFIVLYREGLNHNFFLFVFLFGFLFISTIFFGHQAMNIIVSFLFFVSAILSYYFLKKKNFFYMLLIYIISLGMIFSTNYAYKHILKPHQKNRIDIVLGKVKDDKGVGYNLKQALIATGSGGLFGNGFMKGTQTNGNYIPEQHTDWIMSSIGEQWGFVGSFFVVVLFTGLLIRLIFLAERQKQSFARILGYGVIGILFFHFSLNILMVLGIFPTIGIPLPFLSYGGSSLWAFTILLFLFLKFDANRVQDW